MEQNQIVQVTAEKISELTKFTPEEIAIVKNTVAKNTTDTELAYFLSICSNVHLNPMMKEIWCYKDNKGNLLVFAGRDGFLKRAQESPLWNGMTSFEVCANDVFEMDVTTAKVTHLPEFKNRGEIIGAYAIVKPKGCELATVEWASMAIYNKKYSAWSTHPAEMIKKVAETHALKKAFGITIIQSDYDYEVKGGVALPVGIEPEQDVLAKKIIAGLEKYTGEDKETIKTICIEKKKAGEFTQEFAEHIAEQIGFEL